MSRNAIVYVDSYNWYHAVFKHHPEWKWLNVQTFFQALRPHENIISIKMFSAWMEHDPEAMDRQKRYFNALLTNNKVSLTMGVFKPRTVHCGAECRAAYTIKEEKKTDVNMAVHLLDDAIANRCESMFIVTGDSDIQPAVEWVANNRPEIELTVYLPLLPAEQDVRRIDYYKTQQLNVNCKFLPLAEIKNHQMKPVVKLADKTFAARPHLWA